MPKGCKFAPRCKVAIEKCSVEEPKLKELSNGRKCRCHLTLEEEEIS